MSGASLSAPAPETCSAAPPPSYATRTRHAGGWRRLLKNSEPVRRGARAEHSYFVSTRPPDLWCGVTDHEPHRASSQASEANKAHGAQQSPRDRELVKRAGAAHGRPARPADDDGRSAAVEAPPPRRAAPCPSRRGGGGGGGAGPGEGPAPAAAAAAGVAAHGRHGPQRRRPAPVIRRRRGAGRARGRLARRVLRGKPGRAQPHHPRLRRRARPQWDRRGTQQHHLRPRWRCPPPQGEGSLTHIAQNPQASDISAPVCTDFIFLDSTVILALNPIYFG